ncbi:MAG: cytochrome c3 family protein [Candidatus Omnitrophota bacterium]|nr:cytochrome c3 family protein [Candidatus Omnitrophota bacterium]
MTAVFSSSQKKINLKPIFESLVICGLAVFVFSAYSYAEGQEKKKAEYVGMSTCAMCHEDMVKEFNSTAHSRIVVPSVDEKTEGQACEACHGAGSLHVDAQTNEERHATIINPGKSPDACYQCHLKQKAEFSLQYHHPLPEGKMTCTNCHDPHSPDGVRPGATASLMDKNEVCAKCHKDQSGPFVFEHEALREGCTVCHNVHGSINDKMLKERDANLCLKCHYQTTFPLIGNTSHSSGRIRVGPCWSGGCHTAPHGSNYNEHERL